MTIINFKYKHNMIIKQYLITCDNCLNFICKLEFKPSNKDMKEDHIITYKDKQFCCKECLEEYKKNINNK